MYFSRSLVPYPFKKKQKYIHKHLSIISFRPDSLKKFKLLKQGTLEKIEGIELMRALENNMNIGTFNLEGSSFSVDTKNDFLKAVKFMNIDKTRKKILKKLSKKVLIFDLDGVIIDSKTNMFFSWSKVQDVHSLKKFKFKNYFQNIGRPFYDILKILGIKKIIIKKYI